MNQKYMKRIIASALLVFIIAAGFTQPAGAVAPGGLNFTVDRWYALPDTQTTFGSWSSTGIFESAGGVYEQFFFSNWNVHVSTVLSDAQGTITLKSQLHNPQPGPNGSMIWTGNWVIVSSSGAYAGIHGQGKITATEYYYDACPANAYGITGPCVMGTETFIGEGHFQP